MRASKDKFMRAGSALALAGALTGGPGCMALTPQLGPTDYAALEKVEDRQERETLYAENTIYTHQEPQGLRYTKGTSPTAEKRSWQSLDAVLRSDANSAAALPYRQLRISRVFTALTVAAAILTVAGTAASAREGLDLSEINGPGAVLLGGGLATLGFGITAGVFYGKTKKGYQNAVEIYNESLGMRLGLLTPEGKFVPPRGAIVDSEGNIVLDQREAGLTGGAKKPAPTTTDVPRPPAEPTLETPPAVEQPAVEQPVPAEPAPVQAPTRPAEPTVAPTTQESGPIVPEPSPTQRVGGVAQLRLRPR